MAIQQQFKRPARLIVALLQQAILHGSRSTVLRPLGWLVGILATLVFAVIHFQAPAWMSVLIVGFYGFAVVLYCAAFVYCLLTDKDALRTERYAIHRLAIEKGLLRVPPADPSGDS